MKKRVGIIGVGKLGNFHCNALSRLSEVELIGIYDSDLSRKKELAQHYHCIPFESEEELIAQVDIVGVIVPTSHHFKVVKAALDARKPVFVEKPITSTLEEAKEIVELSQAINVPVQVGHIERFNPAIRALDGYELNPMFIESHRLAPFDPRGTDVAVILDLMIHDIDIILSLINAPVSQIHANGVAIVSDEADIANARIEFTNGSVANVTASRISQRKMRKMRIFQRDAYISIDFLLRLTEIFRLTDSHDETLAAINLGQIEKGKHQKNILYEKPPVPEQDAMQAEWQSFFKAIDSHQRPLVTAQDGYEALKIAMQIREKITAGALAQG